MTFSEIQRRERIAILMRGGAVDNPTAAERAQVLAAGGGTPAEQAHLATVRRTGDLGRADPVERHALALRGVGAAPDELRLSPVQAGQRLASFARTGSREGVTPYEMAQLLVSGEATWAENNHFAMIKRTGYFNEATAAETIALQMEGLTGR